MITEKLYKMYIKISNKIYAYIFRGTDCQM
jgi:hypothetical protein